MSGTDRTRVVLVRHGESEATVHRVIGGPRTCTGLSTLGVLQSERLRDRLAATGEIRATVLYSSAFPRALETADIIAPALALPVRIEPGFGEHDPGPECDGMSFAEFVERHGSPDWSGDPHAISFPGGETVAEFRHRVGSTLSTVLSEHHGGVVVVACHGGVVEAVFRSMLRFPVAGRLDLYARNTSLTEFVTTGSGHWRLDRYNDAAHLAGLPEESPRTGPS